MKNIAIKGWNGVNSVLNTNAILLRIDKIEENVQELKEIAKLSFQEFQENRLALPAVERMLQISIEACLNIGSHIVSAIGTRRANNYSDIIKILAEEKVLTPDFAKKIARMAGFRNILVHVYLDVDIEETYRIIQENLDDFGEFVKQVKEFLKEYEENKGSTC